MAKNLSSIFKNIILMSGTPDCKQIDITNKFPQNECACSPKMAMENGWICKPTLNLIECGEDAWPSAVRAVLFKEVEAWEKEHKFKPTILVNCGSIDDVYHLREQAWFKDNTGSKFHFISIHSSKRIKAHGEYSAVDVTAEVDGKQVSASEAYEAIEKIDENKLFNDELPILVAQVQMIGEGINVSSFNAVITASSADKTAMQQIGRAIRNYSLTKKVVEEVKTTTYEKQPKPGFWNHVFMKKQNVPVEHVEKVEVEKSFDKVHDGHANVYVLNDNLNDVVQLICNLDQYDLTANCYSWGKRIDIKQGSALVEGETKDFCEAVKNDWLDINDADPDITEIIGNARKFILARANKNWLIGEDNDGNGIPDSVELEQLLSSDKMKNFKEVYIGKGKKSAADMFNTLMNTIAGALENPWHKKLWQKSHLALLRLVLNDVEVAQFFLDHLNKRQIAQLNAI